MSFNQPGIKDLFSVLFETLWLGVVFQDVNGKIIIANPAAERLLGLAPSCRTVPTGEYQWLAIQENGSDIPLEDQPASVALRTGQPVTGRPMGVYNPIENRYCWMQASAIPVFRPGEDHPSLVYSIFDPLMELKQTQELIKDLAIFYQTLFESTGTAMVILEEDYTLSYINTMFEKMSGFSKEEMVGLKKWPELFLDGDQIQKPGEVPSRNELQLLIKNGSIKYVLISQEFIPGTKKTIASLVDISELKLTQLRLFDSDRRYRNIIENVIDGYFEVDLKGNFLFFNQAFCDLSGYPASVLLGLNFTKLADQINARGFFNSFNRVFVTGRPEKGYIGELIQEGGQKRIIEVSASQMISPEGKKTGFQGIARDITEQRAVGREKERLEEEIRQFQKLEAIGRLAGGVAHDFNNLLTGISGYAQLLQPKADHNPEIQRGLKQICELCDRAADLTRQLLAFSRKQPLSSVVVNMNSLIENLSRMLRRIIGEDIDLQFFPASDLWNVAVDPGQMEQILMNMAVNARDALPQGGEIIIKTANVLLDEEYSQKHVGVKPGKYIRLVITDTGKGMDKATQERIFEPFFTTKEPGKGTGLGLSTVYGIIKQHKGNIWVQSEIGLGTSFEIYLPRAEGQVMPLDRKQEDGSMPRGTETILVAEDEEAVRTFVQAVLEGQGYRVLSASSPDEAFELFKIHEWEVALLLTDVVMPGENGFELYKRLVERRPSLKALYMSGYAMDTLIQEGELSPQISLLQKPFSPKILAKRIREILDA